ncbi:MAG: SGNH/GDSL hydrolase family protein [Betaproteobacteria bacterium]|jgi:hypothetical protein|nr:SGNH/GDSL hydrolase family protein [Betaproteobacteria bacterium]
MSVSNAFAFSVHNEVDASLRADLTRLSSMRVLFGHQSVGDNLLAGIRQLSQDANFKLNIAEVKSAHGVAPNTFAHMYVAENTQPLKKLKSFEEALVGQGLPLDLAVLKFCYVDIHAQTDIAGLFGQYRDSVEKLRSSNPSIRIMHVTAPITVIQSGIKAKLKRLMGQAPYGIQENIRREVFNDLLRRHYAGKDVVFDLAKLESTTPDGKPLSVDWKGVAVPALVPSYTDDGEHLNATGQKHAARAFIASMVSAAGKN